MLRVHLRKIHNKIGLLSPVASTYALFLLNFNKVINEEFPKESN